MIDIHAHVLPGLDDGPRAIDETMTMLRIAESEGIRTVVATPHFDGTNATVPSLAASVLRVVQREVARSGLDVRVLGGFEVALSPALPGAGVDVHELGLNGSRYILVEAPVAFWPAYVEECLFWLQSQGLQPILAHAERYATLQTHSERASALSDRGILLQVNGGSLIGTEGRDEHRCAESLLRRGLVDFIGSDCHSAKRRRPALRAAAAKASRVVGAAAVEHLIRHNPRAVTLDQDLPACPAPEQSWLTQLRRAVWS